MFFSTEITYSADGLESLYSDLGVKIHGAIMKLIPTEYAAELHRNKFQPFSLLCLNNKEKDEVTVRISVLEEKAGIICEKLTSNKEITLYGIDKPLILLDYCASQPKSVSSLLFAPVPKGYRIDFLTPATFKRGGRGICNPELPKFFRTSAEKLIRFEKTVLDTEKLMNHIARYPLCNYSLSGKKYNVSGNIYSGMTGFAEIYFADETTENARCFNALLKYSEYCGIGAKTAIGMGGISLTEIR